MQSRTSTKSPVTVRIDVQAFGPFDERELS